jgi:hypothetical protein
VHEHVGPVVSSQKPVSFGVVEPLYRTFHTFHVLPPHFAASGSLVQDKEVPPQNVIELCCGAGGLSRKCVT